MDTLQVAISQDFFTAFAAIPRVQQKKVNHFVRKFRHNPMASGINYEKINDAANDGYRSVRIDQDYRGIVLKPDRGNVFLLLWVDKHDDAYEWARRHRCRIHAQTGSLQLYETTHDAEAVQVASSAASDVATESPAALFACRDRELLRLGVPDERLPVVKALTTVAELEAMQASLPVEAFEALYFLADGIPLDEVMTEYALPDAAPVDAEDMAEALKKPQTQRRFTVVESELELQQMLEAPLEQWRVFLHPLQRRIVERDWNGPVRVLGGAGTGKTVVAMHRARWLAEHVLESDERLLLTTFTRNLAMDIEANLRSICSPELMQRIEVTNIDAWVTRFLKREGQLGKVTYPGQAAHDECWNKALAEAPADTGFADSFYAEEWLQVILPKRVTSRGDYFRASRVGRGVPLSRKQRAAIWPVFEEMRFQLHQEGLMTGPDAVFAALDLLEQGKVERPYRAALVDEVQDLGSEALRLIRALVPEGKNDLMLVGDAHQRIYGRKTSFKQCGINIMGRGRKLRINYRTTEQIRRWAVAVLEGVSVDDLDEGSDSIRGYRSLMDGAAPHLRGFEDSQSEADWVSAEISRLVDAGMATQDICVVARTRTNLRKARRMLEEADFNVVELSRDAPDNEQMEGIRMANMHRIKGLEFRVIFLVGIKQGTVPLELAITRTDDPVEKKSREDSERALLHVAATRAIKALYVSWYGNPSAFFGT